MDAVILKYPLIVKDKKGTIEKAKKNRIEIGNWWLSPVHPNLNGWEKVGCHKGMCPIAENICKNIINLPTHTGIGKIEINDAIELIADQTL